MTARIETLLGVRLASCPPWSRECWQSTLGVVAARTRARREERPRSFLWDLAAIPRRSCIEPGKRFMHLARTPTPRDLWASRAIPIRCDPLLLWSLVHERAARTKDIARLPGSQAGS